MTLSERMVEAMARWIALIRWPTLAWQDLTPKETAFAMDAARAALAAVIPPIQAEALERAAVVAEAHQAEVQRNMDDNISEVRFVQMVPSDNRPLIKARDWLKYTAATIRALKETT
jgi:hypothetical protein